VLLTDERYPTCKVFRFRHHPDGTKDEHVLVWMSIAVLTLAVLLCLLVSLPGTPLSFSKSSIECRPKVWLRGDRVWRWRSATHE